MLYICRININIKTSLKINVKEGEEIKTNTIVDKGERKHVKMHTLLYKS